ncbi:glutathione S-transferase II [Pseudovirgaria hyperparasitica]|uniref:Glutathione S-transferase II n=1 Tax=Pseudovirgaria hyperparasitica TaxID=470096 RepID=A0A6A6WAD0_9PEZI|nr:glutathione S-transferase II [Pseudovirgaria hyperparasitica]KAF2758910.1 glutathione S-transferase II [Pseudovirgaria hyperparasitica]
MASERPTGTIADKGLELLSLATPNGVKVSILLEELKATYGLDYKYQNINIMSNVQKEKWFTDHGPNGRIPVLIDHDRQYSLMEGIPILRYLEDHYDPKHTFDFTDETEQADALQWASWGHGGVGPMQGQANHFLRYAKEKIPYGIQRYVGETERLYGVLNTRLTGRDYVAGAGKGKYSWADIALFGWVNISYWSGVDIKEPQFSEVYRWWKSIVERPTVQKGISIPKGPMDSTNQRYLERLETEPEFKKGEAEAKELVKKAKEQYGYKFNPV